MCNAFGVVLGGGSRLRRAPPAAAEPLRRQSAYRQASRSHGGRRLAPLSGVLLGHLSLLRFPGLRLPSNMSASAGSGLAKTGRCRDFASTSAVRLAGRRLPLAEARNLSLRSVPRLRPAKTFHLSLLTFHLFCVRCSTPLITLARSERGYRTHGRRSTRGARWN